MNNAAKHIRPLSKDVHVHCVFDADLAIAQAHPGDGTT